MTGEGRDFYLVVKIDEDRLEEIESITLVGTLFMVDGWDAGMFFNIKKIFDGVRK